MGPGALAALGAGYGALKTFNDKLKEDREKKRREAELRLSPWTKMSFGEMTQPREVDTLGNVVGGALGGADFGIRNQKALAGAPKTTPEESIVDPGAQAIPMGARGSAPGAMAAWNQMGSAAPEASAVSNLQYLQRLQALGLA